MHVEQHNLWVQLLHGSHHAVAVVELPNDGVAVGFEVTRRLLDANGAPPQIVLISSHDLTDLDEAVGASGARGFIAKSELSAEAISSLIR